MRDLYRFVPAATFRAPIRHPETLKQFIVLRTERDRNEYGGRPDAKQAHPARSSSTPT
jgi:hypothetical protein